MASLYQLEQDQHPTYKDARFEGTQEEWDAELAKSTIFYVGNLSFYTTEEQIYALFSKCGEIKRIIMGLDRVTKIPCGFCFVEYYLREDAEACFKWVNGTRLDDRTIRLDWDISFREARQYGRGKSGGQVRDEYRTDYDPGRGGYGKQSQREQETRQLQTPFLHATIAYDPNSLPSLAEFAPSPYKAREERFGTQEQGIKRRRHDEEQEPKGQPLAKRVRDDDQGGSPKEREERNPRFRREENSDDEEDDDRERD